MSFQFHLYDKALTCLKSRPEQRFTAREIAEWILKTYADDCEKKRRESAQNLSSEATLIQQISAELKPSLFRKNSKIKITANRPRHFYWTEKTDAQEIMKAGEQDSASKPERSESASVREADLYPLLAQFLFSELQIYSKRIDEKNK